MRKFIILMVCLLSSLVAQTGMAAAKLEFLGQFDFSRVKEIRVVKTEFLDKNSDDYVTYPTGPQTIINIFADKLKSKQISFYWAPQAKSVVNKTAEQTITLFDRPELLEAVLTVRNYGYQYKFVNSYIEDYTDYQQVTVKTEDDKTFQVTVPVERSRMVDAHWKYYPFLDIQLDLYDSSSGTLIAKYSDKRDDYYYRPTEPIELTKNAASDFLKGFTKVMKREKD